MLFEAMLFLYFLAGNFTALCRKPQRNTTKREQQKVEGSYRNGTEIL